MNNLKLNLRIILIIMALGVFACSHVNYIGKSYEPTNQVDIYFSKEEVKKEYQMTSTSRKKK
jgi:hypothetical protein